MKILFVCSTNFVRSPLAAALFMHRAVKAGLSQLFDCQSAGAYAGQTPRVLDKTTIRYAKSKGIDISKQSTHELNSQLAAEIDVIAVLDEDSRIFLESQLDSEIYKKVILIPPLISLGRVSIPDPVLGEDSYQECFRLLEIGVDELFRKLRKTVTKLPE